MFRFIRKKKERQARESNIREHSFSGFGDIKTVMILFDCKDVNQIMRIAKDLKKSGKNVLLWTSVSRDENIKTINELEGMSLRIVLPSEKSRWNILSDQVLEEFRNLEYDLLLDFSGTENATMSYLVSNTKCHFCVGLRETDHPVYDFIFLKEKEQDLASAYEQIKNYLNRCVAGNK